MDTESHAFALAIICHLANGIVNLKAIICRFATSGVWKLSQRTKPRFYGLFAHLRRIGPARFYAYRT
jgi:hypothetical protein